MPSFYKTIPLSTTQYRDLVSLFHNFHNEAMPTNITFSEENEASSRLSGTQWIALAVLLTANFTLAVDFSILNVTLPHRKFAVDCNLLRAMRRGVYFVVWTCC